MKVARMDRKLVTTAAIAAIIAGGAGLAIGRNAAPLAAADEAGEHAEAEAEEGEEGEAAAPGTVVLDEARLRTSGITLVRASEDVLGAEIIAQGTVAAAPDGLAVLTARADGTVTRIDKRLGDPVAAGDRIAVVESREAAGIAAERRAAESRARLARATYAREQRLFDAKVTARADLEAARAEAEAADTELARARTAAAASGVSADGRTIAVRSPIAGRITAAPAVLGAYVTAETELFRVANPARLQIEAAVPALDVARITPGDTARLEVGGVELAARVRSVTPALDATTRAATVVLTPGGSAGELRSGQFVRVRLRSRTTDAASGIILPADAVQTVDGRDAVFVRTPNGFKAQPVVVGARAGERIEIASGLKAGTLIAGSNAFLLKAELEKPQEEE